MLQGKSYSRDKPVELLQVKNRVHLKAHSAHSDRIRVLLLTPWKKEQPAVEPIGNRSADFASDEHVVKLSHIAVAVYFPILPYAGRKPQGS